MENWCKLLLETFDKQLKWFLHYSHNFPLIQLYLYINIDIIYLPCCHQINIQHPYLRISKIIIKTFLHQKIKTCCKFLLLFYQIISNLHFIWFRLLLLEYDVILLFAFFDDYNDYESNSRIAWQVSMFDYLLNF